MLFRARLAAFALAIGLVGVCEYALAQGSLRIVVIAGEDAVNIIQQKTAVAPIVEVRDRNDLPVAGATVVFAINGSGATFAGAPTLTVVTNAAGQATAASLSPTAAGALRITARATFQGQTATATIVQSNVMTAGEAAKLARAGGASSGGGLSAGKVIAIVGGIGAAGAGAAVAAGASGNSPTTSTTVASTPTPIGTAPTTPSGPTPPTGPGSNAAPVISAATAIPAVGLVAVTPIVFDVQAADADNDQLTYFWEFPDGTTSDQRAFSRVFNVGGTHNSRITVRDGKTSTSREFSFEMKTVDGRWDWEGSQYFSFVQSGTTVVGTFARSFIDGPVICPLAGTLRSSAPELILDITPSTCSYTTNRTETGETAHFTYEFHFELAPDAVLSALRGVVTHTTTTTFRGTVTRQTATTPVDLRKR